MKINTVNPYTQEVLGEYEQETPDQIRGKISELRVAQTRWAVSMERRLDELKKVRDHLQSESAELARLLTLEMGKPITQSQAELKKCGWLIDYILENAAKMLAPEDVKTEGRKSYIRFDPLGIVLLIEPWNFPAWQVIRAAFPALAAGNAVILKHASIVSGTSLKIQEIFGLDVFKSVIAKGSDAMDAVKYVDGVALTGSTDVGASVSEAAGRELKKVVMELGGSDPFIVLDDTNLQEAIKNCAYARLQNNGQSCIAAKRFIVREDVYDEFYNGMRNEFSKVKMGDPSESQTFLGPLSSKAQRDIVAAQIQKLHSYGQVEKFGEELGGNFIPPTIARINTLFDDEVFGPVAILKSFRTPEEAVHLANETPFGLGASIWGQAEEAERLAPSVAAGMLFINKIVASDPRLPFGGVKKSGLGCECSRYGLLEFTAKRTVWVN
jgi:succinate-semialdehyde dehydrogenase / glutarate-semialdehyde dehydrogenase